MLLNFPAILLTFIFIFHFSSSPILAEQRDIWDEIKDMDLFYINRGSYACPLPVVGERCPESNWLFYFRCCGELNTNCCFRLQDWAVFLIALFVVLIIISAFVNLLRCIFCH
uniref:Uncharacterized protein n=1 Tax=Meloidogyne floridensis TaxID=298350 RepID=A0A915P503_9BILA